MPGKWKQTLERTRKIIFLCYLSHLNKQTNNNKATTNKNPPNPPFPSLQILQLKYFAAETEMCLPARIPVTAAALESRGSISGKGQKNSNSRALLVPDSHIEHLPKVLELRHAAFCVMHQLSKNFDN